VVQGPSDFDLLAAALRADDADLHAYVEALAAKLEGAFPDRTRVERKRKLLGGRGGVEQIDLRLGDEQFRLRTDDGGAVCARRRVVRGITLNDRGSGDSLSR
jgi:hypothetical protein